MASTLVGEKIIVKVLIIGDSGVGKTSLLSQYVSMHFAESTKPTLGADFRTKDLLIGNAMVTLQIWDTAGQERYAKLGAAFYRGTQACILVCDVNNEESVEGLAIWQKQFMEQCEPLEPCSFPFVVVANKIDLATSKQREKVRKQIIQWWETNLKDQRMEYFETSAREGENVDDVFWWIAEEIMNEIQLGNYHSTLDRDSPQTLTLDDINKTKNKKCCG